MDAPTPNDPAPTVRFTLHAFDGGSALATVEVEPIDVTGWADTAPTGVAVHRRAVLVVERP